MHCLDNNPSDTNPYSDLPELLWVAHKLWPKHDADLMSAAHSLLCESGTPKWWDIARRDVVKALV